MILENQGDSPPQNEQNELKPDNGTDEAVKKSKRRGRRSKKKKRRKADEPKNAISLRELPGVIDKINLDNELHYFFILPKREVPAEFKGKCVKFTDERIRSILQDVAEGFSLQEACRRHNNHIMAVRRFLSDPAHVHLRREFEYAKTSQAELYAYRVIDLANMVVAGRITPQAAKVAMDGYRWAAAKLAPRAWGEKLDISHELTGSLQVRLGPIAAMATNPKARELAAELYDMIEPTNAQQQEVKQLPQLDDREVAAVQSVD